MSQGNETRVEISVLASIYRRALWTTILMDSWHRLSPYSKVWS